MNTKRMKKFIIQSIAIFFVTFNCWGANFVTIMYGEKYSSSDFESFIPQEFISKFPAEKFEIFILVEAIRHDADLITCTATVGISPAKSFQYPQKTFVLSGFELGGHKTNDQRRELGLKCLQGSLKKMTSSNLDSIYTPAKR